MKGSKLILALSVVTIVVVVAMVSVSGISLFRKVENLEATVTKIEDDAVVAKVERNTMNPSGDGTEYVAPLGENTVVEPEQNRILAVATGGRGLVFGLFVVCLVVVITLAIRFWHRRNG